MPAMHTCSAMQNRLAMLTPAKRSLSGPQIRVKAEMALGDGTPAQPPLLQHPPRVGVPTFSLSIKRCSLSKSIDLIMMKAQYGR